MKLYPLIYKGKIISKGNRRHPFYQVYLDIKYGIFVYKYPLCCIFQYVIEILKREPPSYKRHKEYSYNIDEIEYDYVPCDKCLKGKEL